MMSKLNKQTEQSQATSVSSTGAARRRMILASLGKGSAVVAAVSVPMQSLAAIGTLSVTATGQLATVSGAMSGVHSAPTTKEISAGWNPSYYSDITKWPNYDATSNPKGRNAINGGSGNFNKNTLFSILFGSGTSEKLIDILGRSSGTADEASWIAAVLNGTHGSRAEATNFPYTAAQVIAFYKAGGLTATNALAFFQGYMQTHTS
jgi:hypothetical protein